MTGSVGDPTVLVADDDADFTETVAFWLRDEYDVRTAESGDETLRQYDESVDVVLLDRWFSEWAGDELLSEIRERPGRCFVAIVTAAEPDLDLLDLSFDEYLMKPIGKEKLATAVERLLSLRDESQVVREYYALRTTLGTLESPRRAPHVGSGHALAELRERVRRKRARLGDARVREVDLRYDSIGRDGSVTAHEETTD